MFKSILMGLVIFGSSPSAANALEVEDVDGNTWDAVTVIEKSVEEVPFDMLVLTSKTFTENIILKDRDVRVTTMRLLPEYGTTTFVMTSLYDCKRRESRHISLVALDDGVEVGSRNNIDPEFKPINPNSANDEISKRICSYKLKTVAF